MTSRTPVSYRLSAKVSIRLPGPKGRGIWRSADAAGSLRQTGRSGAFARIRGERKAALSLRDAVVLTLENNSQVRVQEGDIESSKFTLLGRNAPFDSIISSVDNIISTISPPFAFLGSIGGNAFNFNFKNTTKNLQFNYLQTFETGTQVQTGLSSNIEKQRMSHWDFSIRLRPLR